MNRNLQQRKLNGPRSTFFIYMPFRVLVAASFVVGVSSVTHARDTATTLSAESVSGTAGNNVTITVKFTVPTPGIPGKVHVYDLIFEGDATTRRSSQSVNVSASRR